MNTYSYRAMKDDGKKLEGMYEANSRDEVVEMITANGFYPLKVEEVTKGKKTEIRLNNRVTTKDLAIFCRQLYTMLDAGVSITNSLNMLAMQLPSPRLRTILSEIEESVKKGEMLSVAMKAYHVFHRLPVPRHSPCALVRLTIQTILFREWLVFPLDSFLPTKIIVTLPFEIVIFLKKNLL